MNINFLNSKYLALWEKEIKKQEKVKLLRGLTERKDRRMDLE